MAVAAGMLFAAGCGSSKPAYCSTRDTLSQDIKNLPSAATSGGTSGLQAQLAKIKSDANTLVSQAKSDYPQQTQALSSTVNQLESAVKALPSNPSAQQIAPIALDVTAVVNSAQAFVSAAKSSC